jgi:hypothetical protein
MLRIEGAIGRIVPVEHGDAVVFAVRDRSAPGARRPPRRDAPRLR